MSVCVGVLVEYVSVIVYVKLIVECMVFLTVNCIFFLAFVSCLLFSFQGLKLLIAFILFQKGG